jgi:hypothetical protein
MIITKNALPRRTVLRGLGAALALPLLDGMVPALTAFAKTAANPTRRLSVIYLPNGIRMDDWIPAAAGTAFELKPILQPLASFRNQLLVLTGLSSGGGPQVSGVHARASTKFLTDIPPKLTQGADLEAGISMDQLAAKEFAQHTQLASLELSLESTESGTCDVGYACAYTNTIAWRGPTTPLPMEHNPRAVFERLFGDSGSTDPTARLARIQSDRSLLDSLGEKISRIKRNLGPRDVSQLSEYLEAVRDVERRIQKAEEQNAQELPVVDQPVGIPATFEEHAKLMFDLQVLAYQCDLTRVITFMMGREFSGRTYPEIGVPDAHHPTSHHQNDPEKLAKLTKINTYQAMQFAYYLEKLRSTPDGDGSLLDHMIIIYGAGMSDSNQHSALNLPIVLAGGGAGRITGGRHVKYSRDTPLANLHVTLLDKLGVHVDRLADSSGELTGLSDLS